MKKKNSIPKDTDALTKRISLKVDKGIPDMLKKIAGKKDVGVYMSNLIESYFALYEETGYCPIQEYWESEQVNMSNAITPKARLLLKIMTQSLTFNGHMGKQLNAIIRETYMTRFR